ncbi:MAG: PQQ-dependent sugar dehydrogenase [Dehalococcoidia bacterium]|nr:PQQ-dependent sugar dehydrogenase [Dehalococcoidia bacterium]
MLLASCSRASGAGEYGSRHATVRAVTVAEGLEHPWGLAFLPDGRMLVTERPGRLRLVDAEGRLSDPVPGVPRVHAVGQGGLLDVLLAQDFGASGVIYLSYAEPEGNAAATAVARAKLTERGLEELRVIFRQVPRLRGSLHFGSRLVWAADGTLFVGLGERNHRPGAQDLSNHLGTVIRIHPDGSVPADNPFTGVAGAQPEIWSYGHRNIQGAALHPDTGELWITEHGAMGGDELNIARAGRNYGWPVITYGRDYTGARIGEGTHKEGMEQPLHYWDPSIAPSGLTFYTGDRYPGWRGSLFVGSLKFGRLARLELDGDQVVREERLLDGYGQRIRDVRQGPDGYLYLLTDEPNGRIVRLEPAP